LFSRSIRRMIRGVRISRTTTGGTTYAASFSSRPSPETLRHLDAIVEVAVRQVLEEKGAAWAGLPEQEPPAPPPARDAKG